MINDEKLFKDKNNRRDYDKSKYKAIKDENSDYGNFEVIEQILINDGHLSKNIKDKEYNDVSNYEYVKILEKPSN